MSFHSKLARKAFLMGRTPQEFRIAAQKHANATWGAAAIGGVVWYFVSWQWALVPFGLAAYTMLQSISASLLASELAKLTGTPVPK